MKNKTAVFLILFMLLQVNTAFAAVPGFKTSVDIMKYTKDNLGSQFTNAQMDAIVGLIMKDIKPKYIAIAVPLDDTTGYARRWADSIHAHGAKVIFRGTWSGIEGIYDFPKLVGTNRFPSGTAQTAATDGDTTWLGKTYQYITANPNIFSDGDLWAILPERTEGIFQDETSFLEYNPDIQQNYVNFFTDLGTVSKSAFSKIGKNVETGYTSNNFSELASGWMPSSLYQGESSISVDHYGITHTPQEMENDLRAVNNRYGKPIFLQEWGDYWNKSLSEANRTAYLKSMYAVLEKLANEKILIGFNYWGGWVNDAEGIFTQTNGIFYLNYRAQILADFFAGLNPQPAANSPTPSSATPPTLVTPPVSPTTPTAAPTPNPVLLKPVEDPPVAPTVAVPPQSPKLTQEQVTPPSPAPRQIIGAIPGLAQAAESDSPSGGESGAKQNIMIFLLLVALIGLFRMRKRIMG